MSRDLSEGAWKRCSTCKKELPYSSKFYECSVSTCKHKRKGFQFCSVQCWDAHLGFMNHREAWAEEKTAPAFQESSAQGGEEEVRVPRKTIIAPKISGESSAARPLQKTTGSLPKTDTLVVVSKVKQLIKEQSDFNTSQCAIDALTKKVVEESLKAIEAAKQSGRKTVMGRDFD